MPGHWRSDPAFADDRRPGAATAPAFDDPATFGPGADHDRGADGRRRTWLVLDGVFYTSDVWLDGTYLGDTEGYFFPHTFEVTERSPAGPSTPWPWRSRCPGRADLTAKRNLTGVFQHWDLLDQDWNPGGIWRPVRLEQSGAVRIRHWRVLCRDVTDAGAPSSRSAPCSTPSRPRPSSWSRPSPRGATSGDRRSTRAPHATAGRRREPGRVDRHGARARAVVAPRPRRPAAVRRRRWRCAPTTARSATSATVPHRAAHGRGARLDLDHQRRAALPEGRQPGPDPHGAGRGHARRAGPRRRRWPSTPDSTSCALHAHVRRPELYDAADEAGLLLWQDLPLQWGYSRSVRRQARRQAREAVDLLAHHPSVFVWCGHNEPMALDLEPDTLADDRPAGAACMRVAGSPAQAAADLEPHRARPRHQDACSRRDDGSRPVIAHSGVLPHLPQLDGTDSHLYFGWYHGDERDLPAFLARWPRLARFVSEFGAQAVPPTDDFIDPSGWPDLDWDALAATTRSRRRGSTATCRPTELRPLRRLEGGDPATTRPASSATRSRRCGG